jgi:hypothetical protein
MHWNPTKLGGAGLREGEWDNLGNEHRFDLMLAAHVPEPDYMR